MWDNICFSVPVGVPLLPQAVWAPVPGLGRPLPLAGRDPERAPAAFNGAFAVFARADGLGRPGPVKHGGVHLRASLDLAGNPD